MKSRLPWIEAHFPALVVLMTHLMLWLGLPLAGVSGYGDLPYFYRLAALAGEGKYPLLHYWVEYPPLTPWLSVLLYRLGGTEHAFVYLWTLVLSLADALVVVGLLRLARKIFVPAEAVQRGWWYLALGFPLVMGWWNYDLLVLAFLVWGLVYLFEERDGWAALCIALGVLTKVFPLLTLPLVWKVRPPRSAARFTALTLGLVVLGWAPLWAFNPVMTRASLLSQLSKGSSQTVWALLDGNLRTGIFGPVEAHLDAARALAPVGNPPRVSPWWTLLVFGGLGLWAFVRASLQKPRQALAFLGLTWGLFLLWSPAWSPQWTLYLAPLLLLALPMPRGWLLGLALGLTALLEWPVALSRGWFHWLWLTTPLRTVVEVLAVLALVEALRFPRKAVPG